MDGLVEPCASIVSFEESEVVTEAMRAGHVARRKGR